MDIERDSSIDRSIRSVWFLAVLFYITHRSSTQPLSAASYKLSMEWEITSRVCTSNFAIDDLRVPQSIDDCSRCMNRHSCVPAADLCPAAVVAASASTALESYFKFSSYWQLPGLITADGSICENTKIIKNIIRSIRIWSKKSKEPLGASRLPRWVVHHPPARRIHRQIDRSIVVHPVI